MKSKIEKAKKALEVLTIYATEGGILDSEIDVVFDAREDIEEALDALKTTAPAVDAGPKWISVEERLPVIGETVLAFRGDFMEVLVYDKHHGQEEFYYMDECGYWQEAFRPSVTHWMPLPEPPKEG